MENELNKGLTLQVLIDKIKAFNEGAISQAELGEWGKTLNIMTSIPLTTKLSILIALMAKVNINERETQEITTIQLYRDIFFYIYLGSYLGVPIDPELVSYDNFDLLEPIFGPWIESFAKRDIDNFKEVIHDCLNFYNLKNLLQVFEGINTEGLENAAKNQKELMDFLNNKKDLIHELNNIQAMNDPLSAKILDQLQK